MQLAIKKVGALAASALMVGATLGFAQPYSLADFPKPFVKDGVVDAQIVVGETAATADVVAGIEIAARLGNLAFTSEEKTVTGAGTPGWSVDGDGQVLSTSNNQLFFGSYINEERNIISEGDMDILKTTTFEDEDGNRVDVDFDIYVGKNQIKFTNDVGDLRDEDPQLIIDLPDKNSMSTVNDLSDGTKWLYKIRISFDEPINFSSSKVQTQKLNLFGTEYTISTDSMSNPANSVVLFGGEQSFTLNKGDTVTFVDDDGNEHTFELVSVTDADTIAYKLDDSLDSKDEGDTITIAGTDTEVLIDKVVQTSSDQNEGLVTIKVGKGKIILEDGERVKVGSDEENVDGTFVDLEGDLSKGEVSAIVIGVSAKATKKDYIKAGDEFIDPVFGAFKVVFGGLNPALDSEDRELISVTPQGDDTVQVSFTTKGGDEVSFEWAHTEDQDITTNSPINLADSDNDGIVVVEGQPVKENGYVITDAGGFSHIFEVESMDVTGDTKNDEVVLTDVATGKKVRFNSFTYNDSVNGPLLTELGAQDGGIDGTNDIAVAEEVIDGKTYKLVAYRTATSGTGADTIRVGWGDGTASVSSIATAGDFDTLYQRLTGANQTNGRVTLFPAVDTKNGGALAFVPYSATVNQKAGTTVVYELPSTESSDDKTVTIELNATGDAAKVTGADAGGASSFSSAPITFTEGAFVYNITAIDTTAGTFSITVTPLSTLTATTPALLFIEEDDDKDKESGFVVYPGRDATDDELTVSSTANVKYFLRGSSGNVDPYKFDTLESNSDLQQRVSHYGTLVEVNTDQQGHVKIWYPDEQAVAGVAFSALDADLVSGGATTLTYTQLTPTEVPNLGLLDSEVTSATKANYNLILVGGPAINSLVAELASQEGSEVWDLDTWRDGAHNDMAQIVLVNDAFAEGKAALVVAGHEAPDTRAAARAVANYDKPPFSEKATEGVTAITLTSAEYPA